MACTPLTPGECVDDAVGSVAGSALDSLVNSLAESTESMLRTVSTFWLSVPSPAADSPAVAVTRLNLEWLVAIMVVAGLMVAMARLAITNRMTEVASLGRMYLILTLVTGTSTLVVTALLRAGDQLAPWFVAQATGQSFSSSSATLITAPMLTGVGQGAGLILGLLALLASLLQIVAMLIRGALIVTIMGVLPVLAADTTSESGFFRFRRVLGWLGAAVVYKPVAAILYAIGFLELRNGAPAAAGDGIDEMTQALYGVVEGLIIIILAVIALPALMRFIAPISTRAGGGPSVAGTVGGVASGAVVVAGVIATTGAAAATGGAGAATATGAGSAGGAAGAGSAGGTAGTAPPGGPSAAGPSAAGSSGTGGAAATGDGPAAAGGGGSSSGPEGSVPSSGPASGDGAASGAATASGVAAHGAGLVADGASEAEQTSGEAIGDTGDASGASGGTP